jgi:hypothetical protein
MPQLPPLPQPRPLLGKSACHVLSGGHVVLLHALRHGCRVLCGGDGHALLPLKVRPPVVCAPRGADVMLPPPPLLLTLAVAARGQLHPPASPAGRATRAATVQPAADPAKLNSQLSAALLLACAAQL